MGVGIVVVQYDGVATYHWFPAIYEYRSDLACSMKTLKRGMTFSIASFTVLCKRSLLKMRRAWTWYSCVLTGYYRKEYREWRWFGCKGAAGMRV